MPHFKVSDDAHSHPKVMMAGDAAFGMWNRAGCFAMAYGTDGFVPDWWVKQQPQGITKAKRLIAAELWHCGEYQGDRPEFQGLRGYNFHQWRQDSYEKVEADRKKWRDKKATQRDPSPPMSPGDKHGDSPEDSREIPGYIPNTLYPENSGNPGNAAHESNARGPAVQPEAWKLVKRHVSDQHPQANRTELALQAGEMLTAGTSRDVVEAALERWANTPSKLSPKGLRLLVSDIIRERENTPNTHQSPSRNHTKNGSKVDQKVADWLHVGEPENRKEITQ
jgi:hypothetical protein